MTEFFKVLMTLSATLFSLLGVFVVFRFNTLHQNIRENFEMMRHTISETDYTLRRFTYRGTVETVLLWLEEAAAENKLRRENLYFRVGDLLERIFQDYMLRIKIFNQLKTILIALALMISAILLWFVEEPLWSSLTTFGSVGVLIGAIVWFISDSIFSAEGRQTWTVLNNRWISVKDRYK